MIKSFFIKIYLLMEFYNINILKINFYVEKN